MRRTAAMPVTLALALGAFTLLAVVAVVAIGAWTGYRNTVDLLREQADVVLNSAVTKLEMHLSAAEEQTAFLARALTDHEISPEKTDLFVAMIQGALAATPQITALYFLDTNHRMIGAERSETQAVPVFAGLALDPDIRHMVADAGLHREPYWADLQWRDEWRSLQINLRYPVWEGETFRGVIVANVSVPSLSNYLGSLENEFGYNAFVLVNKRYVLAHPMLQFGFPGLSRWNPMPTLSEVGDPVLMGIWDEADRDPSLSDMFSPGSGHATRLGNETYLFLYREVSGYGRTPWLVGSYLRASDLSAEFERLLLAIVLCLGVLVIVLVGSVIMGRRISRPAQILAREARVVQTLDLDAVRPVPGSYFRELNDAAQAFNAMLVGLKWFQTYVPKTLVRRLIAAGVTGDSESEVRQVTVLFTDVADFTGLSAHMTPPETAEFLNKHFAMISDCVLAEGGTIDKFIGDSVMAFWGAPEQQPDHAARALRAARAITKAVAEHNTHKALSGSQEPPLRMRIGVHCGPAVVGNIGSEERLNYTLVGQTVIVAHRLEQFGRALPAAMLAESAAGPASTSGPGRDSHGMLKEGGTVVLATAETVAAAGIPLSDPKVEHIGIHRIRGALKPLDLVRIL